MKTKYTISFMLIVAVLLGVISATAQGILVKKKDGTVINVPYAELDSISTYDNNDTPGIVDVESVKTFDVKGVKFNMVFVEGGSFEMGATQEQSKEYTTQYDEYPVHTVTLSNYYIGETEVTQELWFAVMGMNPSYNKGENRPVERLDWDDCQEFINRLTSITRVRFRMPTEAEWEFAARGGNKSNVYVFSGSNNVDDVAWYSDNSDSTTHEVGTKAPNELGIYDMSGNVWEWCADRYGLYNGVSQTNPTGPSSGFFRVIRGGSWNSDIKYCRVSYHGACSPDRNDDNKGLRLAL